MSIKNHFEHFLVLFNSSLKYWRIRELILLFDKHSILDVWQGFEYVSGVVCIVVFM